MRQSRIKVDPRVRGAVYHVMTRTVNGEMLFDDAAKEMLRRQLWQISDYCGVEILTYAVMSNHFHVLLRVPRTADLDDGEILRRYQRLYPKPTRHQSAQIGVLKKMLKSDPVAAEAWRSRQLALMGDVSMFMKLLKQRFSIWYNRQHERFGTLWAERFKSVLIESKGGVLTTIAAYIDLNAVRAGLVTDPAEYRFCGYGEAVAGQARARRGLTGLFEGGQNRSWRAAQRAYRTRLFGVGSAPKSKAQSLSAEQFRRVLAEGGELSRATVLRHRIRFFSDGAVLGSREFVNSFQRRTRSPKRRSPLRDSTHLPPITDWGGLWVLHPLRGKTMG